ncbi:MAG: hypothetical protein ACLQBB_15445 [Solirubrobacteraceae bacterium]
MRRIAIAAIAAMMVALAIAANAWGSAAQHFGPYASNSPDEGTCGNTWANDTFNRLYTVKTKPKNGAYNVVEQFKNGTFTTLAGPSPGACGTDPGGTLSGTVTGKMQGSFSLVVSGGTYNAGATCSALCYTSEFVTDFFGAGATYEVTSYDLHYSAKKHGVWKNASADKGGNSGDITG